VQAAVTGTGELSLSDVDGVTLDNVTTNDGDMALTSGGTMEAEFVAQAGRQVAREGRRLAWHARRITSRCG